MEHGQTSSSVSLALNPVYQAVVDAEDAGHLLLDSSGRVTYASDLARDMLSMPGPGPDGVPLEALAFPPLTKLFRAAVLNPAEVFVADVVLPERGEPGRLRVKCVTDPGDSVIGALAILRSTAREKELDRMKADFLAAVSHELRTPLTSILGYSNLLYEAGEAIGPEDQKQFLQTIEHQGRVLLELINDLLEMAKLDSDQLKLEKEACPPGAVLTAVFDEYSARAEEAGIDLHVESECTLLAHCDPSRIQQAIGYLVDNGLKFTPQGGSVILAAYQKDDDVVMQVTDTGCGIALENQTRLFEKFYQVDAGAARCVNGTGLGLAIVKRIVQLHGGRVFLESEPGHGSTFGLVLPGWSAQGAWQSAPGADDELLVVSASASLVRWISGMARVRHAEREDELGPWAASHTGGAVILDCELEESDPELFRTALVCAHGSRLRLIVTGSASGRWFSPFALRILDDQLSMEEMAAELASLNTRGSREVVVFADAGDQGSEALMRLLELASDKVLPAHSRFSLRKRLEDPQVSLLGASCHSDEMDSLSLLEGAREAGWLGNLAVFCSRHSTLPETFGRWLSEWASEVAVGEAQGHKRLLQLIPDTLLPDEEETAA